ncbi:MAG TPA: hypothetical protein PLD86_06635 [Vicinamibacteria bacterium]|nr:hypothetical protein [Vicinamibacteria bacterium]
MDEAEPQSARAIRGFVAPQTLLNEVQNTAPWLPQAEPSPADDILDLARGPLGFLAILAACRREGAARQAIAGDRTLDYFGLCLACHHATVATFVPTDVDTKIRGLLWRLIKDPALLDAMIELTEAFCSWDVASVSRRTVCVPHLGLFAGHHGERLSVLVAALGRAIHLGRADLAERMRDQIAAELMRESQGLTALLDGRDELDVLRMAAVMTHNAGDIDQSISFWPQSPAHTAAAGEIRRLAHENVRPWNGSFALAARIYRVTLAPEGHRNYPLRPIRSLRQSYDFLIETAPFLDDWGERMARDPRLEDSDRSEILEALIVGCRKIQGQRGYQRAAAGMVQGLGNRVEAVVSGMPARARSEFKDAGLRKAMAVPRVSFESSMKSMLRKVLRD